MSGQVSRGSAGEYQADDRAGVARHHAELVVIQLLGHLAGGGVNHQPWRAQVVADVER